MLFARTYLGTLLIPMTLLVAQPVLGQTMNSGWLKVNKQITQQVSQLDAGYPSGCTITALVYALKLGPPAWEQAYENIPGNDDIEKIRSLAQKFSTENSSLTGLPYFSEEFGTDPHGLPAMVNQLLPAEPPLTLEYFFNLPGEGQSESLFLAFSKLVKKELSRGEPVIALLTFSDPDLSHAVLITGLKMNSASIELSILDPWSGRESISVMTHGRTEVVGNAVNGLIFENRSVLDRLGVLYGIFH